MEHFFSLTMAPKQALSELNDKIDSILSILKTQSEDLKKVKTQLEEQLNKVKKLESDVASLYTRISSLEKENLQLKEELNHAVQQSKANNIRLLGVPTSDEETKSSDGGTTFFSKVYEKYIKPCLQVAPKHPAPPTMSVVISNIYCAGKITTVARPPPIVITFSSPHHRLTVLCNKSKCLPSPSPPERSTGIKRYIIVEDERVAKVWSMTAASSLP